MIHGSLFSGIGGFQGDFYFDEITLKMFAYAYKIHCEKIRELNEKERNS